MFGCLEDWFRAHTNPFAVHADPERIEALRTMIRGARSAWHCPNGVAASIRGRVLHLSGTKPGKTGRGNYPALSAAADGATLGWSEVLDLELAFLQAELLLPHTRLYLLVLAPSLGPRVWTDASFEPNGSP